MDQTTDNKRALVLSGNGAELGDFNLLANDFVKGELSSRFPASAIIRKRTITREEVMQAISDQPAGSIQELHIFCHSIGGGLYPGYHVDAQEKKRYAKTIETFQQNRKVTYEEALNTEVGGILTDHILFTPLAKLKLAYQAKFAKGATGKFWGCNSGVANWLYSDMVTLDADGHRALVYDPSVQSAATKDYPNFPWREFYWRVFNTQNTPKPSIAQALANFFGITISGATSGTHMEVTFQNHWITTDQYKLQTGHYPGGPIPLRMRPDRGDYGTFQAQ